MSNSKDFFEEIRKIVIQETKYNRFYNGKVVELQDKAVLCTVDSLGLDTNEKGLICVSVDKNSLTSHKVDDYVVIGFVNNDPAQAFIAGTANNFENIAPQAYNFNNKVDVLYQDRDNKNKHTTDFRNKENKTEVARDWKLQLVHENGKKIEINESILKFNEGTKSFVLGEDLQSYIDTQIVAIYGSHTHPDPVSGDTGTPSNSMGSFPSSVLSDNIKGD